MQHDVVLGLKQYFPVAVPYMLVAPLMIFIGNIYFEESVLSMPSDQNQTRQGLLSYDFSFSWKETGTKKKILLSKLMQISLKIILF